MRFEPFFRLLLARIKEPLREPEVVFWVFVFPMLMALGLGIAFRNKPQEELVALLAFGYFLFDVRVAGSFAATGLVGLLGALSFGALGILVASRAQKIESVSGLMNLVMLPMFVFSGIFFSSDRFPEWMQPFIQALPLTMLNDALRAVIVEGATLSSQAQEIAALALWGAASFFLSVKWFRWT